MRRWLCFIMVMCCMAKGSKAIEAVVAYKIFYSYQDKLYTPYIELYWQIASNTLTYNSPDSNNYQAKIKTYISITDSAGNVVKTDAYILQTQPARTKEAAFLQKIIEVQRYVIPTGKLYFSLQLEDIFNPKNKFNHADSAVVLPVTQQSAYTSLQLLDTTYSSSVQDMFAKNGNIQIPLCADFLDNSRHYITYYTELMVPPASGYLKHKFKQQVFISKKPQESVIYRLQQTDSIQTEEITPVYGRLNIERLPSGNYYLNIALTDNGKKIAYNSLFFQRINTKPKIDTSGIASSDTITTQMQVLDLSTTFVSKYTLPQLKAILKMLKPICNEIELVSVNNFVARPDETYIKYFIYNFWKQRSPLNPKAEWEKYVAIIKEVNRMFGVSGIAGYETERGVIYLKYGKPDEMVSVSNEQGTEPYEIWTYNTLPHQSTGGMLLFYRPGFMTGDYRVLHSNIRGEMRNPDWRAILYKTGRANNNVGSRAEQYFPGNK